MSENRTKLQLRSPKHKKALSSLINTNFNFKTFHSPTFSGVTTSKIYTPNLTKVENFITKFQSSHPKFTKSLVNDKVSLILKSSSHNKLNQIKQKEMKKAYNAWAFSTQMESSMIILPENLETLKTSVGFHHFQLSQNEEEKVPFPLDLPMNMKNILKKQLDFNDKQASILKHSLDDIQREKFLKLIALIKKNHQLSIKFINHTLKIRKSSYVNTFENPPENDFIEKIESIGDEEYVTPCYRFFVNLIDSQDPANKPVIRESATLNIVNSKGYLFGGLSSKVLNTLDEINSSNLSQIYLYFRYLNF